MLTKGAWIFATRREEGLQLLQCCKSRAILLPLVTLVSLVLMGWQRYKTKVSPATDPSFSLVTIRNGLHCSWALFWFNTYLEYKAKKFYRLKKLHEGSISQQNLGVLMFCPDWYVSRGPELLRIMSSCLMNKNLCFEIHRCKFPKSKSFSNVLVTIYLLTLFFS